MQNKAVVFFVFYAWSATEIFRWVEMPQCLNMVLSGSALFLRKFCLGQHSIWFGTTVMYLERSDDISVLCRVEADGFKS
jgi:hypothetical protein